MEISKAEMANAAAATSKHDNPELMGSEIMVRALQEEGGLCWARSAW